MPQCRDEIGLACFRSTADNDTLWERCAGGGAGVCIEVDLPDGLLGTQLHAVQYWDKKVIRSWPSTAGRRVGERPDLRLHEDRDLLPLSLSCYFSWEVLGFISM